MHVRGGERGTMSQDVKVAVLMGSRSDLEQMEACREALRRLEIPHETRILSAHRTPRELTLYVDRLEERGIQVVVAAAGIAAHLAGVVASHTCLPVLGVPMASGHLQGMDALLSTVQMPGGVPVATMGIGPHGARNAAYHAARILSLQEPEIRSRLREVMAEDCEKVLAADRALHLGE